ncbi:MAG: hypothetical protein JO333_10870, partial [Verrucomicrobia bacterium]|nr:hypothetical protein [Verrucomicrobiota bacterium]
MGRVVDGSSLRNRKRKSSHRKRFDTLDNFGAIHEFEDKAERLAEIARTYLATRKEGKSSLIVAPTHAECRAIADVIRDQQKKQGLLGAEEYRIARLSKLNLTESQKRDPISYQLGQVVEFHRRARGECKSGERWDVAGTVAQGVIALKDGHTKLLPLGQTGSFELYTSQDIVLATGDAVRITKNFRVGARQLRNNELCTVKAIDGRNIVLNDNRVISYQRPLHLDQGIAVTSHAAQGKTVDEVIVSVPVAAFSQASQAQFYVSM